MCNDFLETARHLATTIIDELNLAVVEKTIQPVLESDCHGRSVEGNRGHDGKRYKYEAFNIRLNVCCDDHGLFNGDDECAAKGYGGREVLGALEYMKQHQPGECKASGSYVFPSVGLAELSPYSETLPFVVGARYGGSFNLHGGLPWLSGFGSGEGSNPLLDFY